MSSNTDQRTGFTVTLADGRRALCDHARIDGDELLITDKRGYARVPLDDVEDFVMGVPAGGIDREVEMHVE